MNDNIISVIDISKKLGIKKQSIFKIINKLKIQICKEKNESARGQSIAYISIDDEKIIIDYFKERGNNKNDIDIIDIDYKGCFYLIQLEPEYDLGRFKVGFATNIDERIRQHKCSAPLLKLIKIWPCKMLWEKTVIDCVTDGCEKIHTEVFRCSSIEEIERKCNIFFDIMPKLK